VLGLVFDVLNQRVQHPLSLPSFWYLPVTSWLYLSNSAASAYLSWWWCCRC